MSQAISDVQAPARSWHQIAAALDHTLFKPEANRDQIIQLSEEGIAFGFAAVCVNPCWISLVASIVHGTPVKVASTIGFPLGANLTSIKRFEAHEAVRLGAQELDMVMNIGALKSGDRKLVQTEIESVAKIVHNHGAIVKVILEAPLLSLEEKILSCQLCLAAKADFVKTATGFAGIATVEDVALLRGVVGDQAGVKASGGIRTATAASAMLDAGADRIGTSSSVAIMKELGAPEFSSR
ncbi:MAG TPA: deoxyribose-phosphate aldolase [Candidatus Angelobacter sp.]|nr:deoxyribose-phosphate aldolase [Candidatus Angelobacter sp.]